MTDDTPDSDVLFQPWGATTGIGSLPHLRMDDALDLIAATCPEVPYWPQLPALGPSEQPLLQALGPAAHVVHAQQGILVSHASEARFVDLLVSDPAAVAHPSRPKDAKPLVAGLAALVAAVLVGRFPRCRAVKGQLYGPVTLAGLLRIDGQPALRRPRILEALATSLARQAHDHARALATCGVPALVVIDEPGLAAASHLGLDPARAEDAVTTVLSGARAGGALTGLHLCGAAAAHPLAAGNLDVALLDVSRLTGSTTAPTAGIVGWGAVPTGASAPIPLMTADIARRIAATTEDPVTGLARSLITPACGLASVPTPVAERTAHHAQDLSAHLRRLVLDDLTHINSYGKDPLQS